MSEETGSVSLQAKVRSTVHRCHLDQLRPCWVSEAGNGSELTHMPGGEPERGELPEAGQGDPAPEENILSPKRWYPAQDDQPPSYHNDYKC